MTHQCASRRRARLRTFVAIVAASLLLLLVLTPLRTHAYDADDFDDDDADADDDAQISIPPEAQQAKELADASLLWGTYRPQIYFGLRPRLPDSLLTGLAWFGLQDYANYQHIRHQCSDQDGMKGFTWKYHDGREFGVQEINDNENNYRLETSFLKVNTANKNGGSWGARISGTVLDPTKPASLTTFWYTAIETLGGTLGLETEVEPGQGIERHRPVRLAGSVPGLGDFVLRVEEPEAAHGNSNTNGNQFVTRHSGSATADDYAETVGKSHVFGKRIPVDTVWKGKDVIQNDIAVRLQQAIQTFGKDNMPDPALTLSLSDQIAPGSTIFAVQKSFTGNFTFDVFYDSASTPKGELLSSAGLTQALRASRQAYDERFTSALRLNKKNYSAQQIEYARDLTSSITGGIGFYHGSSIVDRTFKHEHDIEAGSGVYDPEVDGQPNPQRTEPEQHFTATPCRNIFPRGFYWDEGFHLAHIGAWDNDLSLDILRSWIRLIDRDGWVAREQILGDEARSRVPDGFQTQYPQYGNPPTLILAVSAYVDRLVARIEKSGLSVASLGNQEALVDSQSLEEAPISEKMLVSTALGQAFLREIYPKLRRHYRWFRRTQRGEVREWDREATSRLEAYRWRGRTKDHVLTSGLDDYPRAPVPHTGELHVDLHSWMGSFADTMTKIARVLGKEDDVEEFSRHYSDIVANLEDLHWSEENKMYCDASVDEHDQSYHVCHAGYVSLFPFMLELLPPDSPHLGHVLDLLSDPEQLWSPYGIRSLSLKDEHFGKGDNYWRGPVWVHMSYLSLRALRNKYATTSGPHQKQAQQIYERLRENVVANTFKEYERTGYVFEQYNPKDGKGQRGYPFTGWTSTVALMMAEIFP
ncbi:Glycoside hydrolase, family 63 [Kalmanozyma brasiliensis GHG001]|uniref:Mannosyl-oligosaccharide glucosidase n=1 Tax=Kalmanozyma brasiliensis (strain GHG001) TaxID=1365824 RepID=V5ER80_KALBG|nr:Glycoside hydrolase, family 63 [Kalmanozyma brasiliensis GHG001]EST05453.1 Glycoside hydrolase, family 63 [Kalmanozyma brasiliensis GHG001]